jgi:SH3-like domain-containing protein
MSASRLLAFVAAATLAVGVLSGSAQAQRRTLCVHDVPEGGKLDVFAEPKLASRVVGQFAAKACDVRVSGRCAGAWCQMTLGGVTGWVETRHIGVYELPAGGGEPVKSAQPGRPEAVKPVEAAKPADVDKPAAIAKPKETPTGGSSSPAAAMATVPAVPTESRAAARGAAPPRAAPQGTAPVAAAATPEPRAIRVEPRQQRQARGRDDDDDRAERLRKRDRARERAPEHEPEHDRDRRRAAGYLLPMPPLRYGWAPEKSGACVVGVERGDTLRIRTGPGVSHEAIGGIPPGACRVAVGERCRGPWCRIAWRGQTGWVNTDYLD